MATILLTVIDPFVAIILAALIGVPLLSIFILIITGILYFFAKNVAEGVKVKFSSFYQISWSLCLLVTIMTFIWNTYLGNDTKDRIHPPTILFVWILICIFIIIVLVFRKNLQLSKEK